jgi:NADPH:quinone reductase-like Zn-dependent oxidoreductase
MQREGKYPPPQGSSTLLGVEFSGKIAQLGTGTSRGWKVGDEVLGLAGGVSYISPSILIPGRWSY